MKIYCIIVRIYMLYDSYYMWQDTDNLFILYEKLLATKVEADSKAPFVIATT